MHIKYKQKNTAETILNLLRNGENCHRILSFLNYPQTIVTQIYFAERFGRLSENLTESHAFLKRKAEAKQRFIKTIQYPLILIGIFMCMLFGINYFILPEFQQIYTTMDIQLSPLLKISQFHHSALSSYISNIFRKCWLFNYYNPPIHQEIEHPSKN